MKNSREQTDKAEFIELTAEELQSRWKEAVSRFSGAKKPLVGIFWYYNKKVYGDFFELAAADPYGNVLGPHSNHVDFWHQVQKQVPELTCEEEYEYIPRGRVLFDLAVGQFVLISSKAIVGSKTAVKAIRRRCNIPAGLEVILKTDLHYESPDDLDWD